MGQTHMLTRLEHDAEALLAAIKLNPDGQILLRESRITPIYNQPLSGHYYLLVFADGSEVRSRSLWDETLETHDVASGEIVTYEEKGPGQQQLLLRSAGYEKHGKQFTLTIAEDLSPLAADIRYFQMSALFLLGLSGLTIILIQRLVLRRGFRALDQVRTEVTQIALGETQFLVEMGPSEIQPLTAEINRLLTQLQLRLKRSRDALGNLAHALKGPLSLMTHDIDRLPLADTDRQHLADKLASISSLIERELKRARFGGEHTGQQFLPGRDIPYLLKALQQIHFERHITIKCRPLPDNLLPFDQQDMLELLGNLLDNAFKWANKEILLDISLDNHYLHIQVDDDGPGVSETDLSAMVKRGTRLDEQESGYGLGLSIINDLVTDYTGNIEFSASTALGGLAVKITLPMTQDKA